MNRWLMILAVVALGTLAGAGGAESQNRRDLILREEIEASRAGNAHQLIAAKRPQWLRTRGTQSFREQGRVTTGESEKSASSTPGLTTIVVYLDNAYLGGVETLRNVPLQSVKYVQHLTPAQATLRWGGGHTHGAILVSTQELPES